MELLVGFPAVEVRCAKVPNALNPVLERRVKLTPAEQPRRMSSKGHHLPENTDVLQTPGRPRGFDLHLLGAAYMDHLHDILQAINYRCQADPWNF